VKFAVSPPALREASEARDNPLFIADFKKSIE
jgi:hypothetical protein